MFDWQTMVSLVIVAAAAVYLVLRLFYFKPSAGCASGCSQCPVNQDEPSRGPKSIELVQLDSRK